MELIGVECKMKDKILIGVLVAVLLLSTTAVMASQFPATPALDKQLHEVAAQSLPQNFAPSSSGQITINVDLPAFTYANSWNNFVATIGFDYTSDTEPYNCSVYLDGTPGDVVSVNNDTYTYLNTSSMTLTDGIYALYVNCTDPNSNASTTSVDDKFIVVDSVLPTAQIKPLDDSYIGEYASFAVLGNGTGSPPDNIELTASDGSFTSGSCSGGGSGDDWFDETMECNWQFDASTLSEGDVVSMNITLDDSAGNSNTLTGYSYTVDKTPPVITTNNIPSGLASDVMPFWLSFNVSDNYQVGSVMAGIINSDTNLLISWTADVNLNNGVYNYVWPAEGYDVSQGGNTEYQASTFIVNMNGDDYYYISGLFDREGDGNYVNGALIFNSNKELEYVSADIVLAVGEDLILNSKFKVQDFDTSTQTFVDTNTVFLLYDPTDPVDKLNNPILVTSAVPSGDYSARIEAYDEAGNMADYTAGFEVDNTIPQITITADKTTVNNAGNNPAVPSPPITFTATITDKNFAMNMVFFYDTSKNTTTEVAVDPTSPFSWDTKYFTLDGADVMAVDFDSVRAVYGHFKPDLVNETDAWAYFNASTGEFLYISQDLNESVSATSPVIANVSTFEPMSYKGVGGLGVYESTGKVLTIQDENGESVLENPAGSVTLLTGVLSPAGKYTAYVFAVDMASKSNLVGFDITINNDLPNPPCTSCGGGGGGGGSIIIKPGESMDVNIDTGRSFVFSTDGANTHTIRVTGINGNSADITVMSEPIKVTMNVNDVKDIDWNNNGKNDLKLTLLSINGTTARVKVNPLVETAAVAQEETQQGEQTGVKVEATPENGRDLASGSLLDVSGKGNITFFAVLIAVALLTWACTSRLFRRKKPEQSSVN
jgi:hypothetical protein